MAIPKKPFRGLSDTFHVKSFTTTDQLVGNPAHPEIKDDDDDGDDDDNDNDDDYAVVSMTCFVFL